MIPISTATIDADLLGRFVRDRDEAAFTQLVHQYQAMVTAVAWRRTGDLECAREVAQGVFLTLARRAPLLLEHRRIAGWLYQAASFQAARSFRTEQRRRRRESEAAVNDGNGSHGEDWERLEGALQRLSGTERGAVVLHYFHDRSYSEMSGDLGLSEAAVRQRVSRGIRHLGVILQRQGTGSGAIPLLTGAVALQASLPAQASMAGAALTAAPAMAGVTWALTFFAMTSNTLIKTTLLVVILAIGPLGWQLMENAALRRRLNVLTVTPPPSAAAIRSRGEEKTAEALTSARRDLSALRQEYASEAARLAALEKQAKQLQEEVVVTIGQTDTMARSFAGMQLAALEMEAAKDWDETRRNELGARLMPRMAEMFPLLEGMKKIMTDPRQKARFMATGVATMLEVVDEVRDRMEILLLPHFEQMQRSGLAVSQRPRLEHEDWDRRYGEASVAAMRSIEHLVPEAQRQNKVWQDAVSTNQDDFNDSFFGNGFLDVITGETPAKANKP